jgi:hypothetical protein
MFERLGAVGGDVLVAEFDVVNSVVYVRLGDEGDLTSE